jgi:serine/threonine protein kinase
MSLQSGQRLGPYEIEAPAGKGGMGEVYRAKDTRLDRTVAIKVLPSHAAMNTEARARFEREARTISSLNHPHICTLFDVGHQDGIDYLVMEFMEGESLDERLKRGKFETVEALNIGAQIAAALDAAHRKGLIHRDLKPSNIYLTKEGAKLLDFGLAKLHAEAVTGMETETRTTPVTGSGAIVGTLQYMSPEQLEGREADARSDIFAFGATLYEMLTGQRAFTGESKASLIGSIMKEQPRSISELQEASPPALDRLIKKCLQKDPDDRWQSAKDLKDELEWIASAGSQAGIPRPVASRRRFRMRLAWLVATVAVVAAVVFGFRLYTQDTPELSPIRFSISKPESLARIEWPQISPDGRCLAFLGYDTAGTSQIWVRPLDSKQAFPLAGTLNTYRPFWSPDSKYLAFFDEDHRQLMKVPAAGGQPQLISKTYGSDGSWGKDNVILFDNYQTTAIGWVSASGGESKIAATPDTSAGEGTLGWPVFLPDGRHFIYTAEDERGQASQSMKLRAGVIGGDLNEMIGEVGSQVVFCPPGYLIYVKEGYLVAHPFDAKSLEFQGDPIPLTDSISFASSSNRGINASASETGSLVWQGGRAGIQRLVWTDRQGHELDTIGPGGDYRYIRISPDESYIACNIRDERTNARRIETFDTKQEKTDRIPASGVIDYMPVWSPDSVSFAWVSVDTARVGYLNYKSLWGPVIRVRSLSNDRGIIPVKWVEPTKVWYFDWPDPRTQESEDETFHLMSVDIVDTSQVDTLLRVSGTQVPYAVSPDNRYYLSGDYWGLDWGIYIYDLERPGQKWRLPVIGTQFRWSPQGDELFFYNEDNFTSLKVDLSGEPRFGPATTLFTRDRVLQSESLGRIWSYDVSPDARRFLFVTPMKAALDKTNEVEVLLNWHAELDKQ